MSATKLCLEFVIAINVNLFIFIEYENPCQMLLQRSDKYSLDVLTLPLARLWSSAGVLMHRHKLYNQIGAQVLELYVTISQFHIMTNLP